MSAGDDGTDLTSRPRLLHPRNAKIYEALKAAGIIRDNDHVRRVIIDINVDYAIVVYIERYGDERLLNLIRTMDGAEIRHAGADDGA